MDKNTLKVAIMLTGYILAPLLIGVAFFITLIPVLLRLCSDSVVVSSSDFFIRVAVAIIFGTAVYFAYKKFLVDARNFSTKYQGDPLSPKILRDMCIGLVVMYIFLQVLFLYPDSINLIERALDYLGPYYQRFDTAGYSLGTCWLAAFE